MADESLNPQSHLPIPATGPAATVDVAPPGESPAVSSSPPLAATVGEPAPAAAAVAEAPAKQGEEGAAVVATEKPPMVHGEKLPPESQVSFKEESNLLADLSENEIKALQELKRLVEDAIPTGKFSTIPEKPLPMSEGEKDAKNMSKEEEKHGAQRATVQEMLAVPAKSAPDDTSKREKTASASAAVPGSSTPEAPGREVSSVVADEKTGDTAVSAKPKTVVQEPAEITPSQEDISIWGIPLLKDDRTDVILLKFLRARDFKVKDAFTMLKNTLQWRKEFRIDDVMDEDLGDEMEKVVFMHGHDRDGHPVCYNVYGELQNKELYQKLLSDEEKRRKFLKWRIQFLERSIRKLDFTPGGVSTIFQVNDLKNSPGPAKREFRLATNQALRLLQDNYPEFVAKQVFINVPWWYLAFYTMISPFLTHRTKSKFVFVGPSKSAETLFKYIFPEQVLIQYGGLSIDFCDCNPEFSFADPVTEVDIKPATKQVVEIILSEICVVVWEIRVVGWEVSYGAEFVPNADDSYTVIVHKATKLSPTDEPVIGNHYKIDDLGKIMLTVDNPTMKKKKLLYRFKVIPVSG